MRNSEANFSARGPLVASMQMEEPTRLAFQWERLLHWVVGVIMSSLLLTGCKGVPTRGEKEARQQIQEKALTYHPGGGKPVPPTLTTHSRLADFLAFAMFNQPNVEAA